jgi:hypothetical protein
MEVLVLCAWDYVDPVRVKTIDGRSVVMIMGGANIWA